ncbi:hypothetical protein OMAG_001934 [Candidatus Omnitrophus magneticus]|uniref:Uncharacterized protein n=1 Tax=Candidatus Omnitrophus magneticus TaxID=1609969 RepID=A0A0F0CLT4_9BACT|nr:hypothetical protein OMAG_001934 [Candidatus Omnitrophus magneticus]
MISREGVVIDFSYGRKIEVEDIDLENTPAVFYDGYKEGFCMVYRAVENILNTGIDRNDRLKSVVMEEPFINQRLEFFSNVCNTFINIALEEDKYIPVITTFMLIRGKSFYFIHTGKASFQNSVYYFFFKI